MLGTRNTCGPGWDTAGRPIPVFLAALIALSLLHPAPVHAATAALKNKVLFGSVNANKRHWYTAGEAPARADHAWLSRLITRRERPDHFAKTLERRSEDINAVIQFAEA
jgi:hypothetical protein